METCPAEIEALENADQEKLRMLDLWQFQRKEIEGAGLRAGEDVELEAERRIQRNAGRLLETAGAAFEALYESPESALSIVRSVARKLDELAKIDEQMGAMRQALEPALIAIQDVAYSLRDYLGRVEANPARLEEIETRLAAIDKLKRKYGGTVERNSDVSRRRRAEDRRSGDCRRASGKPAGRARGTGRSQYEQAAADSQRGGRRGVCNWRSVWRRN